MKVTVFNVDECRAVETYTNVKSICHLPKHNAFLIIIDENNYVYYDDMKYCLECEV